MRRLYECSVLLSNTISESCPVRSGVHRCYILLAILFLTVIDWIMRKTTADKHPGIQWTLTSQHEDLDFADSLAAFSTNAKHLQERTDRLTKYALQAGFIINATKNQAMSVNTSTPTCITISNEPLEVVDGLISRDNGAQ